MAPNKPFALSDIAFQEKALSPKQPGSLLRTAFGKEGPNLASIQTSIATATQLGFADVSILCGRGTAPTLHEISQEIHAAGMTLSEVHLADTSQLRLQQIHTNSAFHDFLANAQSIIGAVQYINESAAGNPIAMAKRAAYLAVASTATNEGMAEQLHSAANLPDDMVITIHSRQLPDMLRNNAAHTAFREALASGKHIGVEVVPPEKGVPNRSSSLVTLEDIVAYIEYLKHVYKDDMVHGGEIGLTIDPYNLIHYLQQTDPDVSRAQLLHSAQQLWDHSSVLLWHHNLSNTARRGHHSHLPVSDADSESKAAHGTLVSDYSRTHAATQLHHVLEVHPLYASSLQDPEEQDNIQHYTDAILGL